MNPLNKKIPGVLERGVQMVIKKIYLVLHIITILIMPTLCSCNTHYTVLTDLIPGTTDPAYEFTLDTNSLGIIAMGDSGSGTENQYAVASWMKTYTVKNIISGVLMAGDNFYEYGVNSPEDPLFDSRFEDVYNDNLTGIPFYPVLGNHDVYGNIDAQILYTRENSRWRMPFLYYHFTYSLADKTKIHFFALDSNIIMEGNPLKFEQRKWLRNVLSASKADWKIVYAHHPLYSNGFHGNNPGMISELGKLLEEYHVDLFIAGHDHDLQVLSPVKGVYHCVSGAAGKIRETPVRGNTLYARGCFGFMTLDISKKTIVIRVIIQKAVVDYELILEHK